jgi:hypothetical protein
MLRLLDELLVNLKLFLISPLKFVSEELLFEYGRWFGRIAFLLLLVWGGLHLR